MWGWWHNSKRASPPGTTPICLPGPTKPGSGPQENLAAQARNKQGFSKHRLPCPHSPGRPAPRAQQSPSLPPRVPSCGKPSCTGLAARCFSPVLYRHWSPVPPEPLGTARGRPRCLLSPHRDLDLCVSLRPDRVTPSSRLQTNPVEQEERCTAGVGKGEVPSWGGQRPERVAFSEGLHPSP